MKAPGRRAGVTLRGGVMAGALGAMALVVASCAGGSSSLVDEARADEPAKVPPGAVALVELFTSEGCSSCPSADDVVADLDRASRASGHRVIPLAFHVDYWDSLGWPDPFASSAYSARQRAYARAFGSSGVYTPQMVVGGTDAFVGSDRSHAEASIARALGHAAPLRVSLTLRPQGSDAVVVAYDVAGALPGDATLALVVVEREATVHVRSGENGGRSLRHTNIVRSFVESPLIHASGSQTLVLPPALRAASSSAPAPAGEIVAFVQRAADGGRPVLGATAAALP